MIDSRGLTGNRPEEAESAQRAAEVRATAAVSSRAPPCATHLDLSRRRRKMLPENVMAPTPMSMPAYLGAPFPPDRPSPKRGCWEMARSATPLTIRYELRV
jgi:hypothetical protein